MSHPYMTPDHIKAALTVTDKPREFECWEKEARRRERQRRAPIAEEMSFRDLAAEGDE